jgi:hypothetical protein
MTQNVMVGIDFFIHPCLLFGRAPVLARSSARRVSWYMNFNSHNLHHSLAD